MQQQTRYTISLLNRCVKVKANVPFFLRRKRHNNDHITTSRSSTSTSTSGVLQLLRSFMSNQSNYDDDIKSLKEVSGENFSCLNNFIQTEDYIGLMEHMRAIRKNGDKDENSYYNNNIMEEILNNSNHQMVINNNNNNDNSLKHWINLAFQYDTIIVASQTDTRDAISSLEKLVSSPNMKNFSAEIYYLMARQLISKMQRSSVTPEEVSECLHYLHVAIREKHILYQAYIEKAMVCLSGQIYGGDGSVNSDEILRDIETSRAINARYPPSLLCLGLFYSHVEHDPQKALEAFTTCIQMIQDLVQEGYVEFQKLQSALHFHRASVYTEEGFEQRDVHKALEDYNQAIELDANNPLLYQMRGTLYVSELDDMERAMQDFQKAQALSQSHETNRQESGSA